MTLSKDGNVVNYGTVPHSGINDIHDIVVADKIYITGTTEDEDNNEKTGYLMAFDNQVSNNFVDPYLEFNIYPNPSTQKVIVTSNINNDSYYELHTINGQLVEKGKWDQGEIELIIEQKGFYIFTIVNAGIKTSKSIIIK